MIKATQVATAAVLGISVLLIFIHPATVGLPAPDARSAPLAALLGLVFVITFALARPLSAAFHELAGDAPPRDCDRLALICTRLC